MSANAVEFIIDDGDRVRTDALFRGQLAAIFADAFDTPPYRDSRTRAPAWAHERLVEHTGYRGFRLTAAVLGQVPLAFSYTLLGDDGQWFTDLLRAELAPEVAQRWLGSAAGPGRVAHGELVELAVAKAAQGKGLGRALHDAALAQLVEVGAETALLAVAEQATSARQLYERSGWTLVQAFDSPSGTSLVQGLRLHRPPAREPMAGLPA